MLPTLAARQAGRAGSRSLRLGAAPPPLARPAAVRPSKAAAALPAALGQRMQTTDSSSQAAAGQVKSDAPWAIGSLVIFGGLFIYLSSPSKGGHGHGHDDDHHGGKPKAAKKEEAEEAEEAEAPSQEEGESDGGGDGDGDAEQQDKDDNSEGGSEPSSGSSSDDDEYVNVDKIEGKPAPDSNAPAGSKALAERSLSAEDGAHLQKKTKEAPSSRPDDTTFQEGVAASKEGNKDPSNRDAVLSNPKKVVANAHTKKQSRESGSTDEGEE